MSRTAQETRHVVSTCRAVSAASAVSMLAQRCVHWADTDKTAREDTVYNHTLYYMPRQAFWVALL